MIKANRLKMDSFGWLPAVMRKYFFVLDKPSSISIWADIYIPTFRSTTAATDTGDDISNGKRFTKNAVDDAGTRSNKTLYLSEPAKNYQMHLLGKIMLNYVAIRKPIDFWRCRTPPTPLTVTVGGSCCHRISASQQAKPVKMQIEINIWYKCISIARYMQFSMRWDNTNNPGCILD